jgi:diguanylate cyclase (GGDEF)-like protein
MSATALLYGIDVVFEPLPSAISEWLQKFTTVASFFGAAVLCVLRGRTSGDERSAWWLFALAMALWGTGRAYYVLVLWDSIDAPFPSPADGFWVAFYPAAFAGLYTLIRKRSHAASLRKGVWLDAVVGALGVGGAGAAVVFQIALDNTSGTAAAIATNLTHPVGDIGLLALAAVAVTITGWKASGVWQWIAAAFVVFVVADSVHVVQVAHSTYANGNLVDLGWPLAALLVAHAAWQREAAVAPGVRMDATVLVPWLFGFGALAVLVVDHFIRSNVLAITLAAGSIFAILIRLNLTSQENRRMLHQSRHEATTDPLTGLGNRRQLRTDMTARLGELDPEQPLLLTLFDLDGFKQYNDTFGHPAGDQLLERLGARLSAAVSERGAAYRMGGDEFCAMEKLANADAATDSTAEAVAALSEHGEAFDVTCSYGSVLLPNEATDPIGALRMADRRMYIRKGAGRVSAGRQSSDVLLRALTEGDAELGVHLDGVANLACATALALGVPQEDMEATRQTALLRDVGKVAIPDEILRKRGLLDASDAGFIKRHTVIGERIISAAPALAAVAKCVRSTHEHFDGGGYPDGLAGEDIPLISRIVAVCDAHHAMVTKRAYRDAWDSTRAVAELRRCSGTQFDAEVVEAFVTALSETQRVSTTTSPGLEVQAI